MSFSDVVRSCQIITGGVTGISSGRTQVSIRMAQELGFPYVRMDTLADTIGNNNADVTARNWTQFDTALNEIKNRGLKLILTTWQPHSTVGAWAAVTTGAGQTQNIDLMTSIFDRALTILPRRSLIANVGNEPFSSTFGGDALPTYTITASTNASPIVVTIGAGHSIPDGRHVYVYDCDAGPANGRYVAKNPTATTFELYLTDGTTPSSAPGAVGTTGRVDSQGVFSAWQPIVYGGVVNYLTSTYPEVPIIFGQFSRLQSEAWIADASDVNWNTTTYTWQADTIPSVSNYIQGFQRILNGANSFDSAYRLAKQFYGWTLDNLQGADPTQASMAILETGSSPYRAGMTGGTSGGLDPRYECHSQDLFGEIKAGIYKAGLELSTVVLPGHGTGLVSWYNAMNPTAAEDSWSSAEHFGLGPYQAAATAPIYYRHATYIAAMNGVELPSDAVFAADP